MPLLSLVLTKRTHGVINSQNMVQIIGRAEYGTVQKLRAALLNALFTLVWFP